MRWVFWRALSGLGLLKAILPSTLPMLSAVRIDWDVLAMCVVVTIGAGLLFGIGPALLASRVDPDGALRAGAAESSSRGHSFMRESLVVAEVALAVVLVVGAGLMRRRSGVSIASTSDSTRATL